MTLSEDTTVSVKWQVVRCIMGEGCCSPGWFNVVAPASSYSEKIFKRQIWTSWISSNRADKDIVHRGVRRGADRVSEVHSEHPLIW